MAEGKKPFGKEEGPDRKNATDLNLNADGTWSSEVTGDGSTDLGASGLNDSKTQQEKWESALRKVREGGKPGGKPTEQPVDADKLAEEAKSATSDLDKELVKKATKILKSEDTKKTVKVKEADLGPVIPGNEERTEGEVLDDAWMKSVGGPYPRPDAVETEMLADKWTEQAPKMTTEKAWSEWLEAKKHSESLERDFNAKYKAHVEELQKGPSGWLRRTFGLKLSMTPELEQMHAAVLAANDESKSKSSQLREFKETKATGYTEDRKEAVLARHQRLLAYKNGIGLHMQRIKVQEQVLAERWDRSRLLKPCLDAIAKHKKVSIGAMAVGAAVIGGTAVATGGASILAAGVLAGFGARYGLNWLGNKTYVKSAENQLQQAGSRLGENFFEKSLTETDAEIEKWAHEIGLRKARVKTASRVAGVAAGMTAAGIASGNIDIGLGDIGSNNTPPTELNPAPPDHAGVTPPGEGEFSNPGGTENPPAGGEGGTENPPPQEGGIEGENESEIEEPAVPAPETIKHPVVRGDNTWNIMEGKGPDASPVGGKSQVLKDMNFSLQERQYWLDRLFDSVKGDEAFARSVGAVKSGNLELIYPGETIDVSKLDEKLLELMHQDGAGNIPTPSPRPEDLVSPDAAPNNVPAEQIQNTPNERIITVADTQTFPEHGPVTVQGPVGPAEIVNRVVDVNQMNLTEAGYLRHAASVSDPNALKLIEEMGMDQQSFIEMYDSLGVRGEFDQNMTVSDWLQTLRPRAEAAPIPDATPYGYGQPIPEADSVVRDASVEAPIAANDNVAAVQNYVNKVEPSGFFDMIFGGSKAFDKIADLTFGQISEFAQQDLEAVANQLGVSADKYSAWMQKLQEEAAKIAPLGPEETIRQYVTRINGVQAAA